MKKTLLTLGVLFVGAGAGAATALLYAPRSGKRTRRDLRKFVGHKLDRMEDFRSDAVSYASGRLAVAKDSLGTCMTSARNAFQESCSPVTRVLRNVRSG